jgi:hypothetical protein
MYINVKIPKINIVNIRTTIVKLLSEFTDC